VISFSSFFFLDPSHTPTELRSIGNIVLKLLEHVIGGSARVLVGSLNLVKHELGGLALREIGLQALPEASEGLLTPEEAGEVGFSHQGHQLDDLLVVRPGSQVATHNELGEPAERLGLRAPAHDLDHLLLEQEGRGLKSCLEDVVEDNSSRRNAQDEAKVCSI